MMINVGATLPREQFAEVTQYLAKNFPERPRPAAVIIPGSAKVTIKEWIVPTPGSRPHDPLATADGAIWYTGQFANVLGRLDPKTGRIKEYPLTPKAGPHGLTADNNGNIWYTANFGMSRRQAQSENRRIDRIPDAKSRGARSAHAHLRSEGNSLVHRARGKHDRAARSRRPAK